MHTHPDAITRVRATLERRRREIFSRNPPPPPHSLADQAAIDPHDGEALYAGWDALRDRWGVLNGLKRSSASFSLDALIRFLPSRGRWGEPYNWPEARAACDHPSFFRWKRLATALMVEPYVRSDFEALLDYAPRIGLVAHVPPNPKASFWSPGATYMVVLARPAFGDIRWLRDQLRFEPTSGQPRKVA